MTTHIEEGIYKVSVYMIKDHYRILSLLHGFEMSFQQDQHTRMNSFLNFKWYLEKHIFIEERALFSLIRIEKVNTELYDIYPELVEQHKEILSEVEQIYKQINQEIECDTNKLRDLLTIHLKYEEKIAYPALDTTITEEEKTRLFDQIKDIIFDS
jgi:hypothetical protein